PYFETGLRGNYDFTISKMNFNLSLSYKNIASSKYYSNLRINAAGSRYYERAPGSNLLFSLIIEI
ncbi:MAG: hypothetical protein RLZZ546_1819, partial [Bacteroidota bacterium]